MKKLGLLLAIAASSVLLAACGEDAAKRTAEAYGFDNVSLTGTPWFGCGHDDSAFYNHSFTATNAKGQPISGVICGSAFKGYTVRLN
jgi:hypothetical protein